MTSLNGVRKQRLTVKETSIANCEVLDEKYRIAVQGIFVGIIIKAGGLRQQTGCLPFLFVKYKLGNLVSSLVDCLSGKILRKILRQQKNRNFSILNSVF